MGKFHRLEASLVSPIGNQRRLAATARVEFTELPASKAVPGKACGKTKRYYIVGMTRDLNVVSVKLPLTDVRRIPGNRSEFVRQAVAEKLARESRPGWRPKTATGRKLLPTSEAISDARRRIAGRRRHRR